ncbi:gamma-tubulin complex component 5 [Eurytemora carolleeae]|uniref:gamma-tubulin complex component 5 n=1 Tax=Eurytemora carolleeae TaxID=1294199 RepID=UPI000C76213C|nr:gamma-tubulin complex component 5 [Eurytemora carolleeae]|eukprot:XP_023347559.1 gamma-tubulin complex component 5-like [Eurytemora affinis]
MVLQVHQEYLQKIHDRCFLHPTASMLKEAVSMIVRICLEVHTSVLESSINTRSIRAWEERYARCHNFLASTLSTMVRRSKLPHIEGLAAALVHSSPEQQ